MCLISEIDLQLSVSISYKHEALKLIRQVN
jgi:hypothetical protein